MGRQPRQDASGAWHHLTNRGADRQDIFSSDTDRLVFEHHLGELDRRGLLEIHAYALMDNHFHLLGRSPDGTLSDAMHRLGCEYARWYNNEHERDGPLFRNRFVSVPVTDAEQLTVATRYIHRNPLAFVPLPALAAYRWSSYGAYLGRRDTPDWLHRDIVEALMGDADRHRAFVERPHPADKDPARWSALRPPLDLPDIERAVHQVTRVDPGSLIGLGGQRPEPLALVLVIAVELRAAPAERLAQRYGLRSAGAVRAAARRARVRLSDDADFAALRSRVISALFDAAA